MLPSAKSERMQPYFPAFTYPGEGKMAAFLPMRRPDRPVATGIDRIDQIDRVARVGFRSIQVDISAFRIS
jgi:hypothetical protein